MGRFCRKGFLIAFILVATALPVNAEAYSSDQLSEEAASYLELLDQGRYLEAWQGMSPIF